MAAPERVPAFVPILRAALVHRSAQLPRGARETLFEQAVVAGHGESPREQPALSLHDRNTRGQAAQVR
jgi:hypothetical protein